MSSWKRIVAGQTTTRTRPGHIYIGTYLFPRSRVDVQAPEKSMHSQEKVGRQRQFINNTNASNYLWQHIRAKNITFALAGKLKTEAESGAPADKNVWLRD